MIHHITELKYLTGRPAENPDHGRKSCRASLHGKSSLRIENVRSDDQGWYECKVLMLEQQYDTFHNGSWVHLTVNGLRLRPLPLYPFCLHVRHSSAAFYQTRAAELTGRS
ncbi:hypothetical protein PAMP_007517 [Pampus punctatissimus]